MGPAGSPSPLGSGAVGVNRVSMDVAALGLGLGGERKARFDAGEAPAEYGGGVAADFGAVLEAVARAGADQQHVAPFGVKIDQQVAIRAVLILADPRFVERPAREGGKAPLHVAPHVGQPLGRRRALERVGIDAGAVGIVRNLEAAPLEIGEAVIDVAAVEIGPAGEAAHPEAVVSGRRREEEHFLAGREDAAAEQLGEDAGQPRTAGEDEAPAGDPLPAGGADLAQRTVAPARRRDRGLAVGAAGADKFGDQGLHRPPRHQRAEAGLVDPGLDAVEIDHREAPAERAPVEPLARQAEPAVHFQGLFQIGLDAREEEQDSGAVEDRQPGPVGQPAPLGQRVARHPCIDLVAAVGAARHPRFAAGRGARVGRAPGVDQQHTLAAAAQVGGGPGPERARADHHRVEAAAALRPDYSGCRRRRDAAEQQGAAAQPAQLARNACAR